MTDTSFIESEERQALRKAVASWVANYGHEYYLDKARSTAAVSPSSGEYQITTDAVRG